MEELFIKDSRGEIFSPVQMLTDVFRLKTKQKLLPSPSRLNFHICIIQSVSYAVIDSPGAKTPEVGFKMPMRCVFELRCGVEISQQREREQAGGMTMKAREGVCVWWGVGTGWGAEKEPETRRHLPAKL